jgi:hypothetical protein
VVAPVLHAVRHALRVVVAALERGCGGVERRRQRRRCRGQPDRQEGEPATHAPLSRIAPALARRPTPPRKHHCHSAVTREREMSEGGRKQGVASESVTATASQPRWREGHNDRRVSTSPTRAHEGRHNDCVTRRFKSFTHPRAPPLAVTHASSSTSPTDERSTQNTQRVGRQHSTSLRDTACPSWQEKVGRTGEGEESCEQLTTVFAMNVAAGRASPQPQQPTHTHSRATTTATVITAAATQPPRSPVARRRRSRDAACEPK